MVASNGVLVAISAWDSWIRSKIPIHFYSFSLAIWTWSNYCRYSLLTIGHVVISLFFSNQKLRFSSFRKSSCSYEVMYWKISAPFKVFVIGPKIQVSLLKGIKARVFTMWAHSLIFFSYDATTEWLLVPLKDFLEDFLAIFSAIAIKERWWIR